MNHVLHSSRAAWPPHQLTMMTVERLVVVVRVVTVTTDAAL
jgi:hypothetical protein